MQVLKYTIQNTQKVKYTMCPEPVWCAPLLGTLSPLKFLSPGENQIRQILKISFFFIHPGNCNSPPRVPNKIRLPSDKTRPMITFCVKLCPFIFLKPLPRNSNKKLSLVLVSVFIISSKQIISPDLYLDNQNPYSCMEAPAASPRLPALPQVIADNCKV